ncbi:Hypothetical_protein [Hexamita inflata]|uniref:Hypothetical_protein n=1 Tax=Hexamita inflata TaxID=28002 RepID=A0ABP1HKZ2_9EUKA
MQRGLDNAWMQDLLWRLWTSHVTPTFLRCLRLGVSLEHISRYQFDPDRIIRIYQYPLFYLIGGLGMQNVDSAWLNIISLIHKQQRYRFQNVQRHVKFRVES